MIRPLGSGRTPTWLEEEQGSGHILLGLGTMSSFLLVPIGHLGT